MLELGGQKRTRLDTSIQVGRLQDMSKTNHLEKSIKEIKKDCSNLTKHSVKFFKLTKQMSKDHVQWLNSQTFN